MAIMGLFSTSPGSFLGDRPQWYTSLGSASSSAVTCCTTTYPRRVSHVSHRHAHASRTPEPCGRPEALTSA
jgi:hypothetical protein